MRVAIDARVLEKKMTGIGRYLLAIMNGIETYDDSNEYILFSNRKIKNVSNRFTQINSNNNYDGKLFSPVWLNFILPGLLKNNKPDIFFTPNQLIPFAPKKYKTVNVVQDVFNKVQKDFHPFSYNLYLNLQLPYSLRNSDAIVTLSQHTKNDIIKYYDISGDKIGVVPHTIDQKFKKLSLNNTELDQLKAKYNLPDKFILYIGVIENRKNIAGILEIADIVQKRFPELKTVLVGRPGFGFESINNSILSRSGYVKHLNYIEDDDLVKLYNAALLFIFPSFYEGFGIPPLEAINCGIPVITSNRSSLVEIVGPLGLCYNPEDYNKFADKISELYLDKNYYDKMVKIYLEHSKTFSLEKNFKKLLEIFRSVL